MFFQKTLLCTLLAGMVLTAAGPARVPAVALDAITPAGILKHIEVLSSDDFDGRAPATAGEQKSLDYIVAQCKALQLEPGNPDGGWLQPVALWGIVAGGGDITVQSAGKDFPLTAQDYRVSTSQPRALTTVSQAPIVFAGYGIVAPEYKWDDYKGMDVHGKAVVILGGDPPIRDPKDPGKLDPKMFLGAEQSYYGRAASKADQAFARGAAAVITLQGGGGGRAGAPRAGSAAAAASGAAPAGRGAPRGGANSGPDRFILHEAMIVRDASSTQHIAATVSLNGAKATELFAASGLDLAALRSAALSPGFKPVALQASISIQARNTVREINSNNVVAKLTGSDRTLRNEYVIYSGHWDHLGHQGDHIFHGASDNASGVAGVLELAHAFAALPARPKRTVVFLFTTAEERGLLGAKYYVQHPLYPLDKTAANINLDYFSNWGWGRTHDFSELGMGMSSLDDLVKDAVTGQGRVVTGDTDPSEGFYWRSDHVEFAMAGVPSLATSPGIDYVGRPAGWGEQKRSEYIANDYHKPTDQIKPDWDLTGAVEDLQVLLEVGYRVAQEPARPVWRDRPPYMHNPFAGK